MTTFSLKLPEVLLREVEQEAATRDVAKSAIIRNCIERTLQKTRKPKRQVSCLDLMGESVGSFRGPRDLSTNRRYVTEAIAASAKACRIGKFDPLLPDGKARNTGIVCTCCAQEATFQGMI